MPTPPAPAAADLSALITRGVELQSAGDTTAAAALFHRVLQRQPANAVALYSLAGIALNDSRRHDALSFAVRCAHAAPASPLSHYIHGAALQNLRRFDEALAAFERALALDPHHVDSLVAKAGIYLEAQDLAKSLAHFERVLAIDASHPIANFQRAQIVALLPARANSNAAAISDLTVEGLNQQNRGEIAKAQATFRRVLEQPGNHFVALYSLAAIALNGGDVTAGLDYSQRCLATDPTSAHGWYIRGCALRAVREFAEAHRHFDRALELTPTYQEALFEKGITHGETKDYVPALIQFNQLLQLNPEHKLALENLATSLTILKRHDEGSQFYSRLLAIAPNHEYALGAMVHARLHSCNWTDFAQNRDLINAAVRRGERSCKPLAFLAISDSPSDQHICARLFYEKAYPLQKEQLWRGEAYSHRKPRIGYVSPDLREHPVGHLMAGVFEHHDKSQFEIYSFSLGINDHGSLRRRFEQASDQFIDVRGKSSREIANIIRSCEIDLLIDLAGPTMDAQPDIFAYRPAPLQAGYLGYPGTTGAPYFDFLIADETVIPREDQQHYSEEIVYVPGCYLPTDSKVAIAERTPTRAEMGLPEEGFVFCSFCHDYKMNPDSFGLWMRILQRVPGSVLWLMKLNDAAENNLRREAELRGISASRLIFATRVPAVEDHLARYRLAGLFLDTFPYNAHTTATDCLRVGLPIVTLIGHSFQSRVATSVLRTLGLPDLAKATLQEYEDFAIAMATSPVALQELKAQLQEKLATTLLYDTPRITQGLEEAYTTILRRSANQAHRASPELAEALS